LGGLLSLPVARGIELGAGYRRVGFHNGNGAPDEDRLRQQVVGTFAPFSLRFRVDERFSRRGSEIGFRLRPLVRVNHRLGTGKPVIFASHESFVLPNRTGWGQQRGYERMRNMVGLNVSILHGVAADLGYLNQYRFGRRGTRAQMDHALSLQLTVNLRDVAAPQLQD
jgi:hypothetical protein